MTNRNIAIVLVVFFMLLSGAFFGVVVPMIRENDARKPVLPIVGNDQNHHVQAFSFVDQDGKTITEKEVAGKICVVEYFFATCKGMCPKMNENMKLVYDKYKNDGGVVLLSHTVDPEHDSVAVLKAYADRFGANAAHWKFLTGDKKQLYDMARYSYLINAEQDTTGVSIDKDFIHDKHFVLVDGNGRIRGFYDGLDVEQVKKLVADIALLEHEKR